MSKNFNKPFLINPDDFLNTLKPKPVKEITRQQIFDATVRMMVRQRLPCVFFEDATGEVVPANFNSSSFVGPLLALVTTEDIRTLRKIIGYERLQLLETNIVEDYAAESKEALETGETEENFGLIEDWGRNNWEAGAKIFDMLRARGVPLDGFNLIGRLCRDNERWLDALDPTCFTSQKTYSPNSHEPPPLNYLYRILRTTASSFNLNGGVLDFI